MQVVEDYDPGKRRRHQWRPALPDQPLVVVVVVGVRGRWRRAVGDSRALPGDVGQVVPQFAARLVVDLEQGHRVGRRLDAAPAARTDRTQLKRQAHTGRSGGGGGGSGGGDREMWIRSPCWYEINMY